MGPTVVRCGRERDKLSSSEAIDTVLAVLMRPHNDAEVVSFQEFFHLIRSVDHNVVLFLRIALHIGLKSQGFFVLGGITPQKVHSHLLSGIVDFTQSNG